MVLNEGRVDRLLRIILGLILIGMSGLLLGKTSVLTYVLFFLGVILIVTGIIGWCPLYSVFGCSTRSRLSKVTKREIQMAVREHRLKSVPKSVIVKEKYKKIIKKKPAKKKAVKIKAKKKKVVKKKVVKKKSSKKRK